MIPLGTVLLYCGQRWRVIGGANGTYMCQLIAGPGEPQAISCWPAEQVEAMERAG